MHTRRLSGAGPHDSQANCVDVLNTLEPNENFHGIYGNSTALVSLKYPYRICDVTESFASKLGFKQTELKNATLRLVFGPKTDLTRLQRVLSGHSRSEDEIWLYRKDGEEIECSIRSSTSDLQRGDPVSKITISNKC